MRLLAYGGTSYTTRCRIGDWPSIPEGALGDRSTLTSESLSFGVGLLEDAQPFLIVRQKQNAHERGGYAFTLLLDPGRDVWERFQWNGPQLALSLFGDTNTLGSKLLAEPERFTKEQLEQILNVLEPVHISSQCIKIEKFSAGLVGSVLQADLIVVPPNMVGFGSNPTMRQLASLLQCVPPCFRSGFGWLVGGSRENGRAFGSRFIIYDQSTLEADSLDCIERGREILLSWQTIAGDPDMKRAIARQSTVPVWEWERIFHESHEGFFKQTKLLAKCLKPAGSEEDLIEYISDDFREEGETADLIRQAARKLTLSGNGRLTPLRTRLLLRNALDGKARLDSLTVSRLDPDVLVQELIKRTVLPTAIPFDLPNDVRAKLWRELIEKENDVSRVPELLIAAVDNLDAENSQEPIQSLAQVALDVTLNRSVDLSTWTPWRKHKVVREVLRDRLREEALKRVTSQSKQSSLDYLTFVDDNGAHQLATLGISDKALLKVIEVILKEADDGGQIQKEAMKWLKSLAGSPLRGQLPLQKKVEIAKAVGSTWQNFLRIWHLYCGQEEEAKTTSKTSSFEDEQLRVELAAMIREHSITVPPNLKELVNVFGSFSQDTIQLLRELRPHLSQETASRWIEGWRLLDPDGLRNEVFRLFLETNELTPESCRLYQFNSDQLEPLFYELLFGGKEKNDINYTAKLETLMARADRADLVLTSIANVMTRACVVPLGHHAGGNTSNNLGTWFTNSAGRLTFFRRFASKLAFLDRLFDRIPTPIQDEVIRVFLEQNEKQFVDQAYELFKAAQISNPKTSYQLAVLRFLRSIDGEPIRYKIGSQVYGFMNAIAIDEALTEMIGKSSDDDSTEGVETEESNSESKHWLVRAKNFLSRNLPKDVSRKRTRNPLSILPQEADTKGKNPK